MASNIPTRRVTRTTRTTVLKDENANARPRITTRAKPQSNSEVPVKAKVSTRAISGTVSTRAKSVAKEAPSEQDSAAQGKRKRSAFGEVAGFPNNTRPKATALKGKSKEEVPAPANGKFDGIVLKQKASATVAPAIPRQPLRTVLAPAPAPTRTSTRVTRASAAAGQQRVVAKPTPVVLPPTDDAMAVDTPALHPPPRRLGTKSSVTATTAKKVSEPATRRPLPHAVKTAPPEEDEAEASRVFKKRRTSSDVPDDHLAAVQEEDEENDEALQQQEAQKAVEELSRHLEEIEREAEADPERDWVDLDAEDASDPLMVSEYVVEIFQYLKEVEQTTMPKPNYMDNQRDLAWKMRGILTDWLIQVHMRFRLLPETLFLAVNLLDRFLSSRVVSLAKLQLVGITCMFIASKVEEIVAPSASNFLYCADSSYTEEEILQAEKYILKTLEWAVNYPNPIHFLRRISKADEYNVQVRTVGKYLLEVQCVEWRMVGTPPSLLAAAAIWLARLILGRDGWTPNLAHYSSYPESALVPTANLMLNYVLRPVRHPSFFKKYASKKYLKASTFVREWALQRWEQDEQVDLQAELPSLKALIRAARERAAAAGLDPDDTEGVVLHMNL